MSESSFMLLESDHKRSQRNQWLVRVLVIGFAVVLLFVIISLISLPSDSPGLRRPKFVRNCSHDYSYDFNLFTLRWPTSECEDSKCLHYESNKWLIHGLWPTYASQGWPQFCCSDEEFNTKDLEPIETLLETNWPNLIPGQTVDSLWRHEWLKHGTCTKKRLIDYFNNTLDYLNAFPVYEWLKESNIVPTNDKTYDLQDFQKVFATKLGRKVVFDCVKRKHHSSDHTITEIRICMNHTTTHEIIDCPESVANCDLKFYYPLK